jgi:hypothetical protein
MVYSCACSGVYKGSTPSLFFNTNAPLTNIAKMWLTFQQCGQVILDKDETDIAIVDSDTVKLKLTQEETLLFSSKYDIEVQLRIRYNGVAGATVTSAVSSFRMNEVIKHEVI